MGKRNGVIMNQGQELPSGQPLWSGILLEVRIMYSIVMKSNCFIKQIILTVGQNNY